MKALKPKISSTVGGNVRGKHTLEAFLSQKQVCLLVKSSKFYLNSYLFSLTKEHLSILHSREIASKCVCIYLNYSDTHINAHNLLQLTIL